MKEGDTISEYFARVMVVVIMRNLGEEMSDAKRVEMIVRTLVEEFTFVVCGLEESNVIKDHAVKVEGRWNSSGGREAKREEDTKWSAGYVFDEKKMSGGSVKKTSSARKKKKRDSDESSDEDDRRVKRKSRKEKRRRRNRRNHSDDSDGTVIASYREGLGTATSNQAEYRGLNHGLEAAREKGYTHVKAYGDSELVVKQMRGEWKVSHPRIAEQWKQTNELKSQFKSFDIAHVPRELKKGLTEKGESFESFEMEMEIESKDELWKKVEEAKKTLAVLNEKILEPTNGIGAAETVQIRSTREKEKQGYLANYEIGGDDGASREEDGVLETCKEEEWLEAMRCELEAIEKNETWHLKSSPVDAKNVETMWCELQGIEKYERGSLMLHMMYVRCLISLFMAKSREEQMLAAKSVLTYLKGTRRLNWMLLLAFPV